LRKGKKENKKNIGGDHMKIQKPYSILAACSALIGRHFLRTACISYEITVSQGASEPPQRTPKNIKRPPERP
jgi:hypothetical protein